MTINEFHLAGQHNQSSHGSGGTAAKLKSGATVSLTTGETLTKSDQVKQQGGGAALLATIDTPGGARQIRLGVIGDAYGASKWRASNKGATANLTPTQARSVADGITEASQTARRQNTEADAIIDRLEAMGWDPDDPNPPAEQRDLLDQHDTLTSGIIGAGQTVSTPWGDVVFGPRTTDTGSSVVVAVKPDDADTSWSLDDALSRDAALDLTHAQARALASKLRSAAGTGQTAAVNEFQGNIPDQLADYWLRGPGAARVRWCTRGSFRRARRLLRGKVPAHMLDGTVANLYHRACGRWPGRRRGNMAAFAVDDYTCPPGAHRMPDGSCMPDTAMPAPGPDPEMVGEDGGYRRVYWSGPLAPIDIATGDRRKFAPGALSTRQLPLPFRWQERAAQGHDGSVVVGALTGYDMADDGTVMGRGYFLDPEIIPDVRKAMHLVEHGVIGPSVDLEPAMDVTWVDEQSEAFDTQQCQVDGTCPDKPEALITAATIAGATLVPITAFAEARAPRMSDHGEFCLNPLHPGPCASGSSGGGGGGKEKAAVKKKADDAAKAKPDEQSREQAQAPGRGVVDALIREKFLDTPQTANDDRTPEERAADEERAAEAARVQNRREQRAKVRAQAAAARERYGPRSKWPRRVRANVEREEKRVSELASQTASTSLTACGCASRAGVTEFAVATDGSTCACDPDGVERPMSAGGEFCACANSQTASADEHNECRPNEFCRNPLHPGPCKGWKKKRVSNGGGSGKSSSDRSGGDGGGTGPTGRLGPDTVAGRAYRIRRARNQSAVRAALEGASREDLLDVAEELGLGRPNNWTNERIIEEIVNESGAPEDSQTAAVRSDFDDLPIASRDMAWDVGEAEPAIARWATDADGDIDFARYRRAFIYQDPDADPNTKGAYKFPVATVIGGELTIVPRAVFAAASRLNQADVSSDAREQIRETLTDLYDQLAEELDDDSIEAPWEMAMDDGDPDDFDTPDDGEEYGDAVHGGEFCGTCGGDTLDQVAAAYGVFGDIPPHPIEKFQRVATGPTPMTVLEDGSVFGHIAAWDSCNRGVRGRCVPPPKSKTNYAQFHTTPIRTTEGTLRVGKIVMGEGHADVNGNMQVTRAFYDKAGKTAAHGRAHEDQWGVFFSGVIGPNLTPADVVEFFSMPPSGHWTEHRPTRSSELIAVAAVNVPGHPLPGPDLVLNQVASGYYEPEDVEPMPVEDAASIFHILDRADWHAEAATLAGNLF